MFGEFDQNFTKFGENNITTFNFTKFCNIFSTGFFTKFGDSPKFSTNQQTTEFSPSLVNLINISLNLVKTFSQHLVSPNLVKVLSLDFFTKFPKIFTKFGEHFATFFLTFDPRALTSFVKLERAYLPMCGKGE